MRLILVNTAMEGSTFKKRGIITPPYWAAVLARKIRDHGDEVELLDLQLQSASKFNIDRKYYENVDAVLVSGMIPCYPQMMNVSKFYRNKGVRVIFGGWAPTSLYYSRDMINLKEHLFSFCDAAVIGESEVVINDLLDDLKKGNLKDDKLYIGNSENIEWVMPDFTIWTEKYPFGAIQTQRGCPHGCKFCSVTHILGSRVRAKPIEFVRKEIKLLLDTHHFKLIIFYDDNVIGKDDGKYARELFTMFKNNFQKVCWFSQCTTRVIDKPELLDLFAESNCMMLMFGFESLLQDSLGEVTNKNFSGMANDDREKKYRELVAMLNKRGIGAWACFIYGFEHDTDEVFERNLKFALEADILALQTTILTPVPGTPLFRESLGNLLYPLKPENWGRYDYSQPVLKRHSKYMDNKMLISKYDDTNRIFYKNTNPLYKLIKNGVPNSIIIHFMTSETKYWFRKQYNNALDGLNHYKL